MVHSSVFNHRLHKHPLERKKSEKNHCVPMQTWQKNEDEGKRCFQGNHILILMQNHDVPDFVFAQSEFQRTSEDC